MPPAALIRTTQLQLPVVDGLARLDGFLTRSALLTALSEGDQTPPVEQIWTRSVPTVREGSRVRAALDAMRRGSERAVGIVDSGDRLIAYTRRRTLES